MNKLKFYLAGVFCLATIFGVSHFVSAASTISGKILRENGTPVYNTTVYAYSDTQKFSDATDVNGDYAINITGTTVSGSYTIITSGQVSISDGASANSLGYHNEYFYFQSTAITVVDGVNQNGVNLSLKQHGMLSGNIASSSGVPIYYTSITLLSKNENSVFGSDYADEIGNYYVTPLKIYDTRGTQNTQGYYYARIYAAGYLPKYIDNIQILDNQTATLNITLVRNSYVSGQITNKNGAPLSNIIIKAYKLGGVDALSYATTDQNGNYQIEIGNTLNTYGYDYYGEYTAVGKYTIEVSPNDASGYAKKTKKITISSDESALSGVNFKLSAKRGSLSGRILTAKKKAINGALVKIYLLKDPTVYAQSYTDASGNYSFSELPTGNYYLSIVKSNYAFKEIAKLKIKGHKTKNYKLGPAGVISGYVFDSVTKKPLSSIAVRLIGSDLTSWTNTYGYYKINYVPTGKRKVFVKEVAYAEQFYLKATTAVKSKKIKVKKGKESKNVNFYLTPFSRIYK